MADGEKGNFLSEEEYARVRGKEKVHRTGKNSDYVLKCVIKWTIAIGLLIMFTLGLVAPMLWCLYAYIKGGEVANRVGSVANHIQIVATLLSCVLSVYAMVQAYQGEKNMAKTLKKLEKLRQTVAEATGLRRRKDNSPPSSPPSAAGTWGVHQDEINERAPGQGGAS